MQTLLDGPQFPGYFWDKKALPKTEWMPLGRWISYEEFLHSQEAEYKLMRKCDIKRFAEWFGVKTADAVKARRKFLLQQDTDDARNMLCKLTRCPTSDEITPEKFSIARDYPMHLIIDFSHGNAQAWCHEDKVPSIVWWKSANRARCFPCGKTYNAIDVLMGRDGLSFIEAVVYLNK